MAAAGEKRLRLARGSRGKSELSSAAIVDDRIVLRASGSLAEETWRFDELDAMKITEDVNNTYYIDFESHDTSRTMPHLVLDSSFGFYVFFGAARLQKLRCKFEFTPARIKQGIRSGAERMPWFRGLMAFLLPGQLALGIIAMGIMDLTAKSNNFWSELGGMLFGCFFLLIGVGVAALIFIGLHSVGRFSASPYLLYAASDVPPEPIKLYDVPLAARFLPQKPKLGDLPHAMPAAQPENRKLKELYEALE
ncbi:MAG TPA: hypothetical protein VKX17_16085 [Planctomycetota bacterium]|nr:hypothetical protein [Planctomycetota bacterium]